jgi:hypothetical protein
VKPIAFFILLLFVRVSEFEGIKYVRNCFLLLVA